MKNILIKTYKLFSYLFFDPYFLINKWRALPVFIKNIYIYNKDAKKNKFQIDFSNLYCVTYEKFESAGIMKGHYFFQDIWAASRVYENKPSLHIDIASRIDGFIAHIIPFTKVKYVDIREIESTLKNLEFVKGSIVDLPFEENSILSLSCLHVIEHIGLGRYGDKIDVFGYEKAAKELSRVLAPGGNLYLGTPIGQERLCFDAHRVFSVKTILEIFSNLDLLEFSVIDDKG